MKINKKNIKMFRKYNKGKDHWLMIFRWKDPITKDIYDSRIFTNENFYSYINRDDYYSIKEVLKRELQYFINGLENSLKVK